MDNPLDTLSTFIDSATSWVQHPLKKGSEIDLMQIVLFTGLIIAIVFMWKLVLNQIKDLID